MERLQHYKTHIEILDEDHREIFLMIRELTSDAVDRLPVTDKLKALKEKIVEHCETEEAIMIAIKFPYYEYHKGAHFQMMEYLHFITVSSNLMNVKMLLQTFEVKFTKHIEDYDMQIYPYIEKNQVKH